jgi:hypothetical protein
MIGGRPIGGGFIGGYGGGGAGQDGLSDGIALDVGVSDRSVYLSMITYVNTASSHLPSTSASPLKIFSFKLRPSAPL